MPDENIEIEEILRMLRLKHRDMKQLVSRARHCHDARRVLGSNIDSAEDVLYEQEEVLDRLQWLIDRRYFNLPSVRPPESEIRRGTHA